MAEAVPRAGLIAVTALPGAGGGVAVAAALAVAAARRSAAPDGVVLCEVGGTVRRPTLVSSTAARALESRLRGEVRAAARGAVCWVGLGADAWREELELCRDAGASLVVTFLEPGRWRELVGDPDAGARGAVVRADLPGGRALAGLVAADLRRSGIAVGVVVRGPGLVATRRALAGIEPGGTLGARARRLAMRLLGDATGQALPLVLGLTLAVVLAGLFLALLGSAATSGARLQRAADLAAVSAARSMRDDHDRLFLPARLPSGRANPAHLSEPEYRERARSAAAAALRANGVEGVESRVSFAGAAFAPNRVRVALNARVELDETRPESVRTAAVAEAYPPAAAGPPAAPGRRHGRRLLRSALLPPGQADAAGRGGGVRPARRRRRPRRPRARWSTRPSGPTPSRPRCSPRIPIRAGSPRPAPRYTGAQPSSTSDPPPRTAGWRPTRAGSGSSSATPGRRGTSASWPVRRPAPPRVTASDGWGTGRSPRPRSRASSPLDSGHRSPGLRRAGTCRPASSRPS